MRFAVVIILFHLGLVLPAFGQAPNLVPNWSFENYSGCTDTNLLISFETLDNWYPQNLKDTVESGWVNLNVNLNYGTPDYFNGCNYYLWSSPSNAFGYQDPFDGDSYVGLSFGKSDTDNFYRESIRVELTEPLLPNRQYCGELFWARSDSALGIASGLGMLLSNDTNYIGIVYSYPLFPNANYFSPQIYADTFLNDSVNWNRLSGSFIANGGEKWLTIGFLFHMSQHGFIRLYYPASGAKSARSYYYIDAVRVYECDPVYENEIVLPQFLSPNDDLMNDFYFISDSLPPGSKLSIYNRWGNEVYHSDNYQNDWDGRWQGHLLPSGTYFAVLIMPKGTRKSTYIELVY